MTNQNSDVVRLLVVEDNPDDVELELDALRQGGLNIVHQVVETAPDLRAALSAATWDIVICDYSMPELNGLAALRIVTEVCPDLPFILVSGTVGEDVAVEAMRAGAQDYILKQNLTRLASAVERELRESKVRTTGLVLQRGMRLLADVGAALGAPLDREANLSDFARVVADGEFGELCIVELLDEGGVGGWSAAAHVEPEQEALLPELLGQHPPRPGTMASSDVSTRGEPAYLDSSSMESGANAAFYEVASALGLRSTLSVSLVIAHGPPIGALHLARGRSYSSLEAHVVEELSGRLAVAIENARLYGRAQAAVALRDEFLSIASHELRTPLTALQLNIHGLRDMSKREGSDSLPEPYVTRVERCVRSVEKLSKLVDTLFDLSRVSSGQLTLQLATFDLVTLVREVSDRFQSEAARVGSTLRILAPGSVIGSWDRAKLEQVLSNLLSNALRYGRGQPIEIEVGEVNEDARIVMVDHGIGIPAGAEERVFGRYERAVSARHYGGLGIGLYVTRELVAAHGGTIEARPTAGGGATLELSLPRTAPG